MAAPVAPDVARVEMRYLDTFGQTLQNTFHVYSSTGWDATALLNLTQAFVDWFTSDLAPLISTAVELVQVVATDLTSLDNDRVARAVEPPEAGTNTSGIMPNNVTYAIEANTGKRGRGRQGRIFVPGLSNDQVLGDLVDAGVRDNWITALDALIVLVAALGGSPQLVVLHRVVNGVILLTQTFNAVLSWVATDRTVDSQRTRLPGHKKHKKHIVP